jgi:hypothetical protein
LLYECRIDCLPELTGGSHDQIQAAEMPIMTLRKLHQKGKGGEGSAKHRGLPVGRTDT